MKDIVVIYHANCPDGFGSAYSAWKKFGDTATYIAGHHGMPPPDGLDGKEVYLIDYSYAKDIMLELEARVARLVVIDHHIGAKEAVESVREHVFDNDHSGAGLAWRYFHPDTAVPRIINYIEDTDIFRMALPHAHAMGTRVSVAPFDFDTFDALVQEVESEQGFADAVERGEAYREYIRHLTDFLAGKAEEVEFEGHRVFAVNAQLNQHLRSELGHKLSTGRGRPFSIMWLEDSRGRGYSMRGDESVDLAKLAQKYGGNGHKGAASFRTALDAPLVFTYAQ